MKKAMNVISNYSSWLILGLSLIVYFAFQILTFDIPIIELVSDWKSILNILLTTTLHAMAVPTAKDSALSNGIETKAFKEANKKNNDFIPEFNKNKKEFRFYVKELNRSELETVRDNFLYSVGDKEIDELTDKERKEYNKLRGLVHNITDINLPLLYTKQKGNNMNYDSSVDPNKEKKKGVVGKVFKGLLFGAMTIQPMVNYGNFKNAFTSMVILGGGLAITFIMNYLPLFNKLTKTIPMVVDSKISLYNGFKKWTPPTNIDEIELDNVKVSDEVITENVELNTTTI